MIKLTQLYNEIRIASPSELPDITDKLTETGFNFGHSVLTDYTAYEDLNELINGEWQNEFRADELSKFYKGFSKDKLLFETFYSQILENLYDVNMALFNKIEDGLYKINKKGYRQGYIEIFPEMRSNKLTGNRTMRMYVVPELLPNEIDDPDMTPQPIFTVAKGFRLIPAMMEDELAEKLESNSHIPGMWTII
jgi:hypothetical protein